MPSSQDTEITLGTGKLLFLFFGLAAICAVFFAVGYSLGRKAEPVSTVPATPAASASLNPVKPGASNRQASTPTAAESAFRADHPDQPAAPGEGQGTAKNAPAVATPTPNLDPSASTSASNYFVQVAAVSRPEDADALADALRKKQYSAVVVAGGDKLFHVQVGPFGDIKEAEAMKTRLISDGYNPILKK